MTNSIELKAIQKDGRTLLVIPEVGLFTSALNEGALVSGGQHVGDLVQLNVGMRLIAPKGIAGRIANSRPEEVLHPVAYGDVLYELEPIGEGAEGTENQVDEDSNSDVAGGLILRAPHTGRFWHRPSPDEPAFCKEGDILTSGGSVGLIEIMKTFTQVGYSTDGKLPSPAKVVKMLAADGEDVKEGSPLIEVEPS